ncbi:MAG: hypothetical protein IK126_12020 [Bacteroidales bacterium]|nr:hypothetical protein [Bacteroidales bacterium]
MKKHHLISLAVGIAALLSILVWKLWPRQLPSQQCDSIFLRYENNKYVSVAYFKDFPINDTTFVDVTTLHATTDSAWVCLCEEFIPPEYPYEFKEPLLYGQAVSQWTVSKTAPHIKVNLSSQNNYDLLVLSSKIKSVCIFHTENKEETLAIIAYQINELPTH